MSSPITRRPSRFAADELGLLALFRAVADADQNDIVVIPDDVKAEYVDDEPGWVRDHIVWEADGRLVAVSAVWHEVEDVETRAYAHLDVHPDFREAALEDEVAQALRASTAALIGRAVSLRLNARESQTWKTAMLDRNSYVAERFYHRMSRDLTRAIADPIVPHGNAIRPLAGEHELPAWHDAFDAGFAGHHDAPHYSGDDRRKRMDAPDYLPEADLVAIGADGAIVGVAWSFREQLEDGPARGWVHAVAVRPEHRGRGVAKSLLLTSLQTLREMGLDEALLAVDAGNETNALRLYESTGFERRQLSIVYLAEVG